MTALGSGVHSGNDDPGGAAYINRDLSWLEFNARVLAQAEDESIPFLERVKFAAIFSHNLDEFFQVRVAGLKDAIEAGATSGSVSPREQLKLIGSRVAELVAQLSQLWRRQLQSALSDHGIRVVSVDTLSADDRGWLDSLFDDRLFPVLTPLAVDPGHPFPYISNLSLNLAVIVRDPVNFEQRFARVKVPPLFSRFVPLPDGERYVPLEGVIATHLDRLFPGMIIERWCAFRVTRNADLSLEEEETDDLLSAVETELRRRRFGKAVRLEVDSSVDPADVALLHEELELGPDDTYFVTDLLDLGGLWSIYALDRPELKDEQWVAVTQPLLQQIDEDEDVDLFAVLRQKDVLVHHPYDSYTSSVEAFVEQAAADPSVLAIKQTLYRTSGDSPIVKSLIRAAEAGKQVATLVELKARFDEQANIAWARALERAGVHVVYGLVGLKTHSKVCLVVRAEADGIRRYVHIGTGNYNPKTARLYEDIGLLTANPEVGADATDLFNSLTGYSRAVDYRRIITAPVGLRRRFLELIAEEAQHGANGAITMKMNALVDQPIIDALYEASRAGVKIDLIVRGICCLRPGVADQSDTIAVRSLVGRYLEHSRIFRFGGVNDRPAKIFIGSADMMPRNLDRRIEVMVPVERESLTHRVSEILDLALADTELSWTLDSKGTWQRVRDTLEAGASRLDLHRALQERAVSRTRRKFDHEGIPSLAAEASEDQS